LSLKAYYSLTVRFISRTETQVSFIEPTK